MMRVRPCSYHLSPVVGNSIIRSTIFTVCLVSLTSPVGRADSAAVSASARAYVPDPLGVQRHGPGYRYTQAGWIVLHIEGEPYDRGFQHGRLMAPEIARFLRCFAQQQSGKAPEEGWRITRTLANSLFLRKFDREFLEEMKGN